jgi:phosphate transport system substrate-binding protein
VAGTGSGRRGCRPRSAALCMAVAMTLAVTACGTVTSGTVTSGTVTSETGAHPGQAGLAAVSAQPGTISESGSGLLYPLAGIWANAYERATPGVTVTTASTGSGKGIQLAAEGKTDIGASDAYLSSGDLVQSPTLLNIPLVVSAQTVIYNLPGLGRGTHVKLNGTVLAGIYDGTITMWDDPAIAKINQGLTLPAVKIVPVHRSDSSGDTFLFTSYLSTQDPDWSSKIGYGTTAAWPSVAGELAEQGSVNTMDACKTTPGCIAYNGISYLSQALAGGLGYASLANAAGNYTLPSAAAIGDSVASFVSLTPPSETISLIDGPSPTGYPIVNYEYAVVSTHQPAAGKASTLKAFLTWVITTGNQASYLNTVGFQPLPSALVTLGEQQIAEIGS